jgi:predicted lipid-binding transport protein (Tim44 family)
VQASAPPSQASEPQQSATQIKKASAAASAAAAAAAAEPSKPKVNWNSKSKQECVAAFKSLLTDLGIVGSDTFDAVLSRMTADDRFAALKSRAERESALFVYSFSVFYFC